jgi:hypothetical protein
MNYNPPCKGCDMPDDQLPGAPDWSGIGGFDAGCNGADYLSRAHERTVVGEANGRVIGAE